MTTSRWLAAIIYIVTAGAFLLGFWPLAALGVVAMGFVGRGVLAVLLGFLLDLAYGAPVGPAAYLFFPFTILGLLVVVLRHSAVRYFFDRAAGERI